MRSLLLFFLCLCLFQPCFAQGYTPVVINGEAFFRTDLEHTDGLVAAEVTVANFEKIDGQLYNRVFFKRGFGADEFIGYLREDPGAGEIYFRTITNAQEFLVYDISLELGDVISLQARWCDGQPGDQAEVIAVNDVDGLRELVFDRQVGNEAICEPLRFLEGVGPSASLIFPTFRDAILENGVAQRICHASHENVIYYPANTTVDLCGGDITSTSFEQTTDIAVFPNPVSDLLNIDKAPAGTELTVIDGYGRIIHRQLQLAAGIDCSSWPAGLYLLHLRLADGDVLTRRVVKL